MKWPWVSVSKLEAAVARATGAQYEYEKALALWSEQAEGFQRLCAEYVQSIAALEHERKQLTDRILQLSGQPALYEKPAVVVSTEQPAQDLPAVPRRVSFDDVHAAARKAMQNGSFTLKGKAN